MSEIDDLIQKNLSEQEAEIVKSTAELGYFALAMGMFTGKLGWVSWVIMLAQAIMLIIGAWAAWRFFIAEETLTALKWGLSAAVLLLMASQMKMSFMPQLQANRVLRALKRVELLLLQRGQN